MVYRQLLVSVITQLWVDYLTQMEALRVSIGLEAYAQRDPLVQYKSRASELFQELLSNMRMEVIARMFTFRVRDMSSVQTGTTHDEGTPKEAESLPPEATGGEPGNNGNDQQDKQAKQSRKHRRRR